MNLMIVEDDHFKFSRIKSLVNNIVFSPEIIHKDNIYDTVHYLKENTPDKLILDMSLPSHAARNGEGSPLSLPNGGISVLLEMKRLKKLSIPTIILTQYESIEIEGELYLIGIAKKKLYDLLGLEDINVTLYDNDNNDWIQSTSEFLKI